MDLETAQTTTTVKLPILKQGEYDMWRLRIEQYFQVQDYALWDVIENENSFKPVAQTTTNADGSSTSLIPCPITTEEKALEDCKSAGYLRNKPDLDIMSFDDLYNNFKIVEQEVKGTASLSSQNMAFVSSPSSTNEVNIPYGVSTTNTQVSPASTQVSTTSTQVTNANLSDDTVYTFLASQPNGSQLVYEDLEQIHEDDIEEMDFKSQLALLGMKTRRGTRNQDSRNRNQDNSRRTINVEETSSKAIVAIDGAGFDWSYMADNEVPTNMALMAFSDSEVHNDKTCSKTCLKSFETLKTQLDDLRIEFNKSEFNLATYKRGLASVEKQLVFYKKNEVIFCEQLAVLKRDISYKDSEISMLKSELEKLKQEKESNQLKIENFDNASKSLDKLIRSQITDKSRKDMGFVSYNVVPPSPTGLFSPPKFDLSNSGLEEFQQPEFESYGPKSVSEDISNEARESPYAPLVEELVSDDNFDHVQANYNYHQRERVVSGNNYTRVNYNYFAKKSHPNAHMNMVPRAVLMKSGLRSLNTARLVTIAHPKTTIYSARPMSHFYKLAQSTVKRSYQARTTLTNKNFSQKVNTARQKAVNTTRPNSAVVNVVRENQVNVVKASACWVWRPTQLNSASITLKKHNYVDAQGRSKFKELGWRGRGGEGYLPLGKEPNEGKLLVKELLKLMCDKKNSVLLTDTGCFVLSPDFKLADESQVSLKVPRKNNMYSVVMKNIVPKESLSCLVAKATLDESMLWHRKLGHVNFKTINKLVKENIVRGLPLKRFENDQTCVVCLKGKQHKASCTEESIGAGHSSKETRSRQDYILMRLWKDGSLFDSSSKNASNDEPQPSVTMERLKRIVNKESGIDD
ncbi:ribonuclease H-like domain-containing protein [Tanacetum coccineum]